MTQSASHGDAVWPKMMVLAVVLLLASSAAASPGGRRLSGNWRDDDGCVCDADDNMGFKSFSFALSAFCKVKKPVFNRGQGLACKCWWMPFKGCFGKTAPCLDPGTPWCDNPSNNLESCLLGGGNCRGYAKEACTCTLQGQGCVLTKAPQPNTACKCMSMTDSTRPNTPVEVCVGFPVLCANSSSPLCIKPDLSLETCQEGMQSKGTGGISAFDLDKFSVNCDGYKQ